MKSMVMAGAVAAALSLTALSQQRAAAQCCQPPCQRGGEISFNSGITLGVHCTPKCGHWAPNCPPPCYGPYGYPPRGYAPPGYPGGPTPAPQSATGTAPGGPAVPPPAQNGAPNGVQNIGYAYPTAYDYNNGYNNYGYLYGSPYYQDPAYWYGYGR